MKRCFKCGKTKPRSEFYPHPQMADGLLGKCKDCTKADSEARRLSKERDPEWKAAELDRHRLKARRYRDNGQKQQPTLQDRRVYGKRHRLKYPLATKARRKVAYEIRVGRLQRKPCEVFGCDKKAGAHHDDYSKPLAVRWLCPEHHAAWHVEQRRKLLLKEAA